MSGKFKWAVMFGLLLMIFFRSGQVLARGRLTVKLPSEMAGCTAAVLDFEGNELSRGQLDARGEVQVDVEAERELQLIVSRNQALSSGGSAQRSPVLVIREALTVGGAVFAATFLGMHWYFRKKYREALDLIYDPESDD